MRAFAFFGLCDEMLDCWVEVEVSMWNGSLECESVLRWKGDFVDVVRVEVL